MIPLKALNGSTYCTKYACLNNAGHCSCGLCLIENPGVHDFGDDFWGCDDEIYPGENKD